MSGFVPKGLQDISLGFQPQVPINKTPRPHKALRSRPRRRPRPRIRPRGVMECWSIGVLRQVRIAPRVRGVGDAEGAVEPVCRVCRG